MEDDFIKVGDKVPDFEVTTRDGTSLRMSQLKGKTVLVNFFATWCKPCIAELPYLQKQIWDVHKDKENFALMVIGREHNAEEVRKFKECNNFSFEIYPDEKRQIYQKFTCKYVPKNYLVDKDGKVVYSSTGFKNEEFHNLMKKLDEQLLTNKSSS